MIQHNVGNLEKWSIEHEKCGFDFEYDWCRYIVVVVVGFFVVV